MLASIETEKLTNDVISEVDGVLLKIVAPEGEDVPVQGLMAYVGQPGEVLPGGDRRGARCIRRWERSRRAER